jgi:multidrug resistance protein
MSMTSNASTLLGTPHEKHHPIDLEAGRKSDHPATPLNNAQDNDSIKDPNIVDWDGPDDSANPRNWAQWKKVTNILLVSAMCLLTPIASSMFAPGVPKLMEDFHSSNKQLATFVVSVFVLGMGIGPMIVGPLSEIYGRLPIYLICNALFVVFTIACGLSTNINMLTGFRFLAGFAGSAPICVGGGTIADLIAQEHRGAAMAAFGLGPMLGPIIGPIAGGYLAQAEGWKWVFWVIAIAVSSPALMLDCH